mmetsp:Transcript_160532/g.515302  ORF Transcript_160532/g.515302 Transcript_160532/m.515302 type:complete len:229 (+) Transcript_160532:1305-1991(+)
MQAASPQLDNCCNATRCAGRTSQPPCARRGSAGRTGLSLECCQACAVNAQATDVLMPERLPVDRRFDFAMLRKRHVHANPSVCQAPHDRSPAPRQCNSNAVAAALPLVRKPQGTLPPIRNTEKRSAVAGQQNLVRIQLSGQGGRDQQRVETGVVKAPGGYADAIVADVQGGDNLESVDRLARETWFILYLVTGPKHEFGQRSAAFAAERILAPRCRVLQTPRRFGPNA